MNTKGLNKTGLSIVDYSNALQTVMTKMIDFYLVLLDYFYGLVLMVLNMTMKLKGHLTFTYCVVSLPMLPTRDINSVLLS